MHSPVVGELDGDAVTGEPVVGDVDGEDVGAAVGDVDGEDVGVVVGDVDGDRVVGGGVGGGGPVWICPDVVVCVFREFRACVRRKSSCYVLEPFCFRTREV